MQAKSWLAITFVFWAASSLRAEEEQTISEGKKDSQGFLVHEVRSSYQAGPTLIRILLPTKTPPEKKLRVVYVLPVEAGTENRYGDGLREIQKLDLANQWDTIFVAPTFAHLPWYADHPTNLKIRQESYFLKVVVPFIDKTYPVQAERSGRFLLGFSKSGWGAWSILLRHPDLFQKAAAWDAPLMMDKPGLYGNGDIFASAENFNHYRISKLLETHTAPFQKEKRLILLGYGNFRAEHIKAQAILEKLKIPHDYRDGPSRKHDWQSGWVAEATELLLAKP